MQRAEDLRAGEAEEVGVGQSGSLSPLARSPLAVWGPHGSAQSRRLALGSLVHLQKENSLSLPI